MTCARLLRMTDYGCGCGIGGDLRSTSTSRTIVGSGPRRPSRAHALPLELSAELRREWQVREATDPAAPDED